MDLTDVYNQIMTEYPNCLESVLSSYKTDEGMYAIPAFEKFTVLVAPESKLDEINGMDGLISYIATCENFPYSNDLAIYDWDYLFNLTYPSCADDIYDFQGNYNEESMEEYVYQLKELWQLLMSHTSEENIADWELTVYNQQEHNVPIHRANYNLYAMYFQEYSGRSVAIAQPEWINDACSIGNIRYANDAKYSFDAYTIFSNDGDCSYIPYMSAGINSQTLNKEYGIEFVVSMFSDDFQQKQFVATGKYADIIGKSGLPSNMDAWHMRNRDENYNAYGGLAKQEVLDFYDDPGYEADAWTYFAFDVDAQEAEFEELFTSLDTPVNMDKIFISMVCEHLEEYLNDEITLDEYMEELNASVMLYINE
jgi:hypothetical protein